MSKTIVITGTTSGIGEATARILSSQGHQLVMLVRNTEKGKQLAAKLPSASDIVPCDLADLASVKRAADILKEKYAVIDVLINNAGGMTLERQVSRDGFEMQFAMNHLGHFLLTTQLLPLLTASRTRVINVSSMAHTQGKLDFDDLQLEKSFSPMKAYGNAKLCNIYFTKELVKRYGSSGISAYALHPGVVNTGFGDSLKGIFKAGWGMMKPFLLTPEKGASTSVYLATKEGIESLSGNYFKKSKVAPVSRLAKDEQVAEKLWTVSEQLIAPFVQ